MNIYRTVFVLVTGLFLSACATAPTSVNGRNAPLADIQEGQGVALAKVIAIARPSAFNSKWRALELEDNLGKAFSLSDVGPPSTKYSIFMGTLPEGRYKVKRLVSEGTGSGLIMLLMSTDSANIESRLPQFEVRKSAATNLGTIVFQLPKGGDATSLQYVISDGAIGRQAALADLYPEDRTTIMSMPAFIQSEDQGVDRIRETESLIAKSPPFLSTIIRLSDDRLVASGISGFLHIRERDGTWHAMYMNSFDRFTSLTELPDKTLAVGTESGKYLLMQPDGKTVETHRLADPDLEILAIVPLGQFGYAIKAVRKQTGNSFGPTSYLVLKKDNLHVDGTEKELVSFDGASAFGVPMYFHKKELLLFFNKPGLMRSTKMSRFNMETGERSQSEFDFWPLKLEPGSGDDILMTRMNGVSFYRSVSKDDAKTWQAIDDGIPFQSFVVTGQVAYRLRQVSTGWDAAQMTLTKSEDGGKTWKDSGVPFTATGIQHLFALGPKEIVAFTGVDIRSTTDEGMTWNVEWPRE